MVGVKAPGSVKEQETKKPFAKNYITLELFEFQELHEAAASQTRARKLQKISGFKMLITLHVITWNVIY